MAEMVGPVQEGSMPGWSKPGCEGYILLSPIVVFHANHVQPCFPHLHLREERTILADQPHQAQEQQTACCKHVEFDDVS